MPTPKSPRQLTASLAAVLVLTIAAAWWLVLHAAAPPGAAPTTPTPLITYAPTVAPTEAPMATEAPASPPQGTPPGFPTIVIQSVVADPLVITLLAGLQPRGLSTDLQDAT